MPVKQEKKLEWFLLDTYFLLGTSWFLYLILGYRPVNCHSHYSPLTPIFKKKEIYIISSLVSDLIMIYLIGIYWLTFGFLSVLFEYFIPLFIFSSWLVVVTFLHHHEEDLGWYNDENWDYVKGNLSSIDRDYGYFHWLTHNIGTHQIHHLFPLIPHYHLEEATFHFRKHFPEYVHISNSSIIPSFFENFNSFSTQFLPSNNSVSVFFYKKFNKVQ